MRLLDIRTVASKTGLSRRTIYNYVQGDLFPRSVQLGPRRVAWVEEEVEAWIAAKVKKRDEQLGLR